jgi:tetratricopeptide (TPR) repeat protein
MVPIDRILRHLSDDVIGRLREPVYPFGEGLYPIVFGEPDAPSMRYYNVQLRHAAIQESDKFTSEHRAALNTLDALLAKEALYHKFHLEPGQILFMHNQKTLHGRTALSAGTDRVIYRMRLSVASLSGNEQRVVAAEDARSHLALAEVLEWLGRFEQALHHYKQASELAPEQSGIVNAYESLLIKIKKDSHANSGVKD